MTNIFKRYNLKFTLAMLILAMVICLMGCATLEGLLTETQEIAATGEAIPDITASLSIIDDFVDAPWNGLTAVGIGYGLALLRRWYKKKKGSKTT